MKKLLYTITLLLAFTFAQAQNDLKARIEFEEAEKAFTEENYETALKHLNETEKLLGQWTPVVSYLKIESLYALTNMENFAAPTIEPLYEEVTQYMAYLNKLKSDEVPMEKYKVIYGIETKLKKNGFKEFQEDFVAAYKAQGLGKYEIAFPLWEKIAENRNSYAIYNLAIICEKKGDYKKALGYYQQSADLGLDSALFQLGYINRYGDSEKYGIIRNESQGEMYIRKAAEMGHTEAAYTIGNLYFFKYRNEPEKSIQWFEKAVMKGNTRAMLGLGTLYHWSESDIVRSYTKAEHWYRQALEKAIEENDKKIEGYAYECLGILYSSDKINQIDQAKDMFEKSVLSGNKASLLRIADIYYSGIGGADKDYFKAAKYYEKYYEIEKKNDSYIDNLIEIYNRGGNGIEKDKEKAKKWKEIRRK